MGKVDFFCKPKDYEGFVQKLSSQHKDSQAQSSATGSDAYMILKRKSSLDRPISPGKRANTGQLKHAPKVQLHMNFYGKNTKAAPSNTSHAPAKAAAAVGEEVPRHKKATDVCEPKAHDTPTGSVQCGAAYPGVVAAPRAEFPLQQQAFDFWDKHPHPLRQHLRVFATELSKEGKRRFMVTTATRIWMDDVEEAEPGSRHLYEIIREGMPCNLYFDLEFVPEFNAGHCGDDMVDLLVELVAEQLRDEFKIEMPLRKYGTSERSPTRGGLSANDVAVGSSWVWELCSTTPTKFSRHLIVRIPHCAFKNNFHVNAFVRRLFDRIAADPARFSSFFVRRSADPTEPPTLFIDPAVYTRNRAFRLYWSSKAGKTAVLHATRRYAVGDLLRSRGLAVEARLPAPGAEQAGSAGQIPRLLDGVSSCSEAPANTSSSCSGGLVPPHVEKQIAREVFFATLITSVGRVDRTLTMYDDKSIAAGGGGGGSGAGASLVQFHSAAAAGGLNFASLPRIPLPGRPGRGMQRGPGAGGSVGGSDTGDAFRYGPSPFPKVEQFIEAICCEGGVQGRVRCWQYLAGSDCLVLSIRDNRWCANVGRPHRSNGIYYVVDLRAGVWCQRCYDPDCRHFRSTLMPLPLELWESCRPAEEQPIANAPGAGQAGADPACQPPPAAVQLQGESGDRKFQLPGEDDDDDEHDLACLEFLDRLEEHMAGGGVGSLRS